MFKEILNYDNLAYGDKLYGEDLDETYNFIGKFSQGVQLIKVDENDNETGIDFINPWNDLDHYVRAGIQPRKISMADVTIDGKLPKDNDVSLIKLLGGKIKDIHGSIQMFYDDPIFAISSIIMEDGNSIIVEGEHHFPYLNDLDEVYDNLNDETLSELYNEHNPEEEEDEE